MTHVIPNPADRTAPADDLYCPGAIFYADGTRVIARPHEVGGSRGILDGHTGTTYGVTEGKRLAHQAVIWDDPALPERVGIVCPSILERIAPPPVLTDEQQAARAAAVTECARIYLEGTEDGFEGVPIPDDRIITHRLRGMTTPPAITLHPAIRVEVDRLTDERAFRVTPGLPLIELPYQARRGGYPYPLAPLNVGDLIMGDATHSHMDRARVTAIEETARHDYTGYTDVWVTLRQRSRSPVTGRWDVTTHHETAEDVRRGWFKIA